MSKNYRTEDIEARERRLQKEISAVSDRICDARKNLGMSQNEVADFARISTSTIKRYEHAEGEMSIQVLFRIASALDLDLAELVTENKYLLYKYSLLDRQDQEMIQVMIDKCYLTMQAQK